MVLPTQHTLPCQGASLLRVRAEHCSSGRGPLAVATEVGFCPAWVLPEISLDSGLQISMKGNS